MRGRSTFLRSKRIWGETHTVFRRGGEGQGYLRERGEQGCQQNRGPFLGADELTVLPTAKNGFNFESGRHSPKAALPV